MRSVVTVVMFAVVAFQWAHVGAWVAAHDLDLFQRFWPQDASEVGSNVARAEDPS